MAITGRRNKTRQRDGRSASPDPRAKTNGKADRSDAAPKSRPSKNAAGSNAEQGKSVDAANAFTDQQRPASTTRQPDGTASLAEKGFIDTQGDQTSAVVVDSNAPPPTFASSDAAKAADGTIAPAIAGPQPNPGGNVADKAAKDSTQKPAANDKGHADDSDHSAGEDLEIDTNIANGVFNDGEARMIEVSGGSYSDSFIEPISSPWEIHSDHLAEAEDEDGGRYGLGERIFQTPPPPQPQEVDCDSSGSIQVVAESVRNEQGETVLVLPGTLTEVDRPAPPPRRPRRKATAEDAIVLSDSEDSDSSSAQAIDGINEQEVHDSDDC